MTKTELLLFYNEVKPYLHLHVSADGLVYVYFENGKNKTFIEISSEVFNILIEDFLKDTSISKIVKDAYEYQDIDFEDLSIDIMSVYPDSLGELSITTIEDIFKNRKDD